MSGPERSESPADAPDQPLERTLPAAGGEPVSLRLTADGWAAFDEVCQREGIAADELLRRAGERVGTGPLVEKLEDYLSDYYRDAVRRERRRSPGLSEGDGAAAGFSAELFKALDAVGKKTPD